MKVAKFGGTSLASAEQIKKVCDIILSDEDRKIVVVSAPGKRHTEDIKVTDLLINCANKCLEKGCADSEKGLVVERYKEIASELGISEDIASVVECDLSQRLEADKSIEEKFVDCIKAAGEDNCAKLIAAYLRARGANATYVNPKDAGLLLSDEYGNARVLEESFDNLKRLRDKEGIIIFPGFFGYSKLGEVVTFPRGGSDITGSILAASVSADVYENFSDVDSVFAANPNVVDNPTPIPVLTYREMRELSYAGFSVLHEETLEPVYKKHIPVCIKNTNNPDSPGTLIVPEREADNDIVAGIACDKGFCSIFISKYLMNREIGFVRRVLNIIEDENLSYEHMPSGIDNVSVILSQNQLDKNKEDRLLNRIREELNVDDVSIEYDIALIMVVGEGMKHSVGVAARATNTFSYSGINIEMINQGSSEVSMMYGVMAEDADKAVRALYNEFFE